MENEALHLGCMDHRPHPPSRTPPKSHRHSYCLPASKDPEAILEPQLETPGTKHGCSFQCQQSGFRGAPKDVCAQDFETHRAQWRAPAGGLWVHT